MTQKDVITLLTEDHDAVRELFTRYQSLGRRAFKSKQAVVERISEELSVHAAVEEQVLYPAIRRLVPSELDDVLESLEEHHIVKTTLAELEGLSPEDERHHAKVTVLIEEVRHHMEEEESEMFPHLRGAVDEKQLLSLGRALESARATAPRRPHPHAPDTPPQNLAAAAMARPLDLATGSVRWMRRQAGAAPWVALRLCRLAMQSWEAGRKQVERRSRRHGGGASGGTTSRRRGAGSRSGGGS